MKDKKRIGDFFKESLEEGGFEPNDKVWSKISDTLKKRKKRRFLWMWSSAVVLILGTLSAILITNSDMKVNKNDINGGNTKAISNKSSTSEHKNKREENKHDTIRNTVLHAVKTMDKKKYGPGVPPDKIKSPYQRKPSKKPIDSAGSNYSNLIDKANADFVKKELNDSLDRKIEDSKKPKDRLKKKTNPTEDKKDVKKDTLDKWNISLQFSPVLSGYLTNRNLLLSPSLNRTNERQLSYAFRILFVIPLNEKMKFRFGMGYQEFNYNAQFTPEVTVDDNFGGLMTQNITSPLNPLTQSLTNDFNTSIPISIEHRIRYLQLPIEVSYQLRKGKIDIKAISGMDFFVLQDDDVLISSENNPNFLVGRAYYLSRLSIAAHMGIGFEYQLSKYVRFQLEPTLTYQFGGYRGRVEHPNPYFIGLYSGFNVRF